MERDLVRLSPLREADVMWSRKIWREIDLRQKMNHPFYYPENNGIVGAAVTAQVSVQSPSGHPGIAATITVNPVTILDTPPINPISGELWWESDTGQLKIYYNDIYK